MDRTLQFSQMSLAFAVAVLVLVLPVYSQITTSCTGSMLSSFSPCMNFVTNSSSNGTSPTSDCCNVLRTLTSNGMDCLCLIATGSVPFQIPINRTLAISLPRACKMTKVPVQCKASAAPVPAPGPAAFDPTSPISPSTTPEGSTTPRPTSSTPPPESSTMQNPTLPSPTTGSTDQVPISNNPVLTPSSTVRLSPSVAMFMLAFAAVRYY